jgi:prepilin-type N-terminal cleavage/methylation domain-containing protein
MKQSRSRAFSLVELLVAIAIFAGVTVAMLSFSQTAMRLVARNFATNHSHEAVRLSNLQMLDDFHNAASPFRLFTFDGTSYTDVTTTVTTDQEPLSQEFVSTRSNGVRFRMLLGGPYKLTQNTTPASTVLRFRCTGGAMPRVGDKVVLPLIAREFAITAVSGSLSAARVTIDEPAGIGFTITTSGSNVTTGCFYREIAYSVYNGQLRRHGNFTGSNRSQFTVVRDKITSPKPFALLFPTSTAAVDNLALRVSLEVYDPEYTNRRFTNGTVTLQTIIPPLNTPTPVKATDTY